MGRIAIKTLEKELVKSFKNIENFNWPGFFKCTELADKILTQKFGLTTDCNENIICNMTVRYNWIDNYWYVSAACDETRYIGGWLSWAQEGKTM